MERGGLTGSYGWEQRTVERNEVIIEGVVMVVLSFHMREEENRGRCNAGGGLIKNIVRR